MTSPDSISKDASPRTFGAERAARGCHTAPQLSIVLSPAETLSTSILLSYVVSKLVLELFGSRTDFPFQDFSVGGLLP